MWPPPPLETSSSPLAEETDTGALRPEAPEFIPQSQSLEVPLEVQKVFSISLIRGYRN